MSLSQFTLNIITKRKYFIQIICEGDEGDVTWYFIFNDKRRCRDRRKSSIFRSDCLRWKLFDHNLQCIVN